MMPKLLTVSASSPNRPLGRPPGGTGRTRNSPGTTRANRQTYPRAARLSPWRTPSHFGRTTGLMVRLAVVFQRFDVLMGRTPFGRGKVAERDGKSAQGRGSRGGRGAFGREDVSRKCR